MREWMRLLFQRDGFEVLTAENGEVARELVSREYVDVVLTDIRMPKLDGVALPLWELVHRAAVRLRAIQQGRGRLHVYLLFVMAALLAMLAYLAIGGTS